MAVYPRHKAVVDKFIARGVVLGIGPFTDGGNMAIFKTRGEAENGPSPTSPIGHFATLVSWNSRSKSGHCYILPCANMAR